MKTINYLILLAFLATFGSCATNAKFSISPITPAAEGVAKITKDKNKNYAIEINVKYFANPDRLTPPRQHYVVWISTDKEKYINLGMLVSNKSNKSYLKAVSASRPIQIFVTAEDVGDASYPGNEEIFHTQPLNLR